MNELSRLADFQSVLADYKISPATQKILDQTKVALLLAPTAGGRNTIIKELSQKGKYHYIVSDTTRKPRVNDGVLEENGVTYWFRSEAEMLNELSKGEFIEAEVIHEQQVSGISSRELGVARDKDQVAITDIELLGIQNVVAAKPDTAAILVLPPSFAEWQKRMNKRGTMPAIEVNRRLKTAQRIFTKSPELPYLHFVINDSVSHAAEQVEEIIFGGRNESFSQDQGRALAAEFLQKTNEFLAQNRGEKSN